MAADAVRVEEFLQNFPQKTTSVEKSIDVETDVGNLLICDINELDVTKLRKNKEEFLLNFTRDNCQILVNCLGQLPVEKTDEVSVVKLPEPTTTLPREKAVPKAKQPTKWELFARMKGIQKKKKGRMIWDSESQEYKPRWGFKRKDPSKSWLLEVPENADPMEDQFTKLKKEKKERVAKNELQRLRNIARTTKSKVPGVGLTPTTAPSKQHLETALAVTHKSTASLGKFMDTLPKEKIRQKKRKFDSNDIGAEEKERQKKILKKISEATPVLDVTRAANASKHQEERQRAESKKAGDGQWKKKAGSKGGKPGKHGKKFAGKGKKGGGKKKR